MRCKTSGARGLRSLTGSLIVNVTGTCLPFAGLFLWLAIGLGGAAASIITTASGSCDAVDAAGVGNFAGESIAASEDGAAFSGVLASLAGVEKCFDAVPVVFLRLGVFGDSSSLVVIDLFRGVDGFF